MLHSTIPEAVATKKVTKGDIICAIVVHRDDAVKLHILKDKDEESKVMCNYTTLQWGGKVCNRFGIV